MDAATGAPEGLVIGQDEDSEIRVQPVTQGGSRHLDIRIWRRGPSGFSPTRDALMLDRPDMESLRRGIIELLEASDGGRQVARIVLDTADGRRLRAETEPFGTRYMAHLGFWQRARNTWRPDGDGISLSADRLAPLQGVLVRYEPWLDDKPPDEPPPPTTSSQSEREPWPVPGADWLTVERDRVAFHPRGVRLTLTVQERGDRHQLSTRQWRREDTLWVPESVSLELGAPDVDALLACLRGALDHGDGSDEIQCADGSRLRLILHDDNLRIDHRTRRANGEWGAFEERIAIPATYLPRLGRALAQSAILLTASLSEAERERLQQIRLDEIDVEPEIPIRDLLPEPSISPPASRTVGPVVRFGDDSDYPGAVIPQEGQIRIIVEGYLLPRGITLPIEVVARVVTGLEELFALQLSTPHIGPMLLCDRPDCAVYGRIGTTTRPEAVEIRVWNSPRDSDSITFDRAYLGELIEGLRHGLRTLGQPEPLPTASFITVQRAVEPPPPPPEIEEEEPLPPPPASSTRIGQVQMGDRLLTLALTAHNGDQSLAIQWDGTSLALPLDRLDELIADIRSLYYEALRGRRGQMLTVGEADPIDIGVHHGGGGLHLKLSSAKDGEGACLSFPIANIPAFLDAAGGALQYTVRTEDD